jgi:hypothetical protein
MENILNLRDEKDRAKERIRLFNEEKRNQALRKRDQERAQMLEALERREMKRLSILSFARSFSSRKFKIFSILAADLSAFSLSLYA